MRLGTAQDGLTVSVVLPTYNEVETIPAIVPQVCAVLVEAGLTGEIIVVDDASPDGTAAVARKLAEQYPVRVLVRERERGLATAALAGFRLSEAAVVVVMDADGSHPPEQLPAMIQPLLDDAADIAVGSRGHPGGGVRNWPWQRRLTSKAASLLALGLSSLSDPTSGFMAVRRELLAKLELDPVGWKIVLEVVVKARGYRVVEVPIVFSDRRLGASKLGWDAQWSYLRHLFRLHCYRRPYLAKLVRCCRQQWQPPA
jgi:dolichol-phosphate mannosyltransferase